MEFVGKIVKKDFKGFGTFQGVIESYDSSTGFFKIQYEDGDSEEADFSEVLHLTANLTAVTDKAVVAAKRAGRKPKRRRGRIGRDLGKVSGNCDLDQMNLVKVDGIGLGQELVDNDENGEGLDLNRGFGFDDGAGNAETKGGIDLNLTVGSDDVDGGDDGIGKERRERGFDLNLGFNDELRSGDGVDPGVDANHVNSSKISDSRIDTDMNTATAGTSPFEDGNSVGRKRRKVAKELTSPTATVLRRSARRAKAVAVDERETSRVMVRDGGNELSVSGVTDGSESKPSSMDLKRVGGAEVCPPKIELPPSSTNLNLEGIPVLDLFVVYSCLRSFSTVLYLSPFELEDFVAALKSRVSNLLIDFIHVSVLQTLRKHLEFLASEGCESASSCLRNMNWDLLDVITWPIFMVEYLLIHGSGLKPGFSLDRLNLFDGEYYMQPAELKLELLRCLCDDVIEVETIRSEISKRMIGRDAALDIDPAMGEDVTEEVADGNSDECRLCKMDGNLICCDGCPAAYHSKCVGIVSNLLPEGDWYCPECVISRNKPQKMIRGAELLGIDPFGRPYFSCFDYLLVSDSCDAESSVYYFHKDELGPVVQLLRSSSVLYGSILRAISQHWAIHTDLHEPRSDLECVNRTLKDWQTENQETSSEGSAEVLQANQLIPESSGPGCNFASPAASAKSISATKQRKKSGSLAGRRRCLSKTKNEDALEGESGDGYVNNYSFARTASSVVKELLRKSSDKVNANMPKTEEEIIAIQLKFILRNSTKFCWMTTQALNVKRQKEKCGWCYCCRFPVDGRDCLFTFMNKAPISEALKAEVDAVMSKKNKKGHLVDVICCILCMEERLRGLLLGPWLSPHYSELWRKSVLKASDVSSLKRPLLMMESNLRPLALSADWWKCVDSVTTMGSASHFVASSRVTSKNGVSRRKGRHADSETKSIIAGGGLGLLWWRGGKISRSLFNWKVVPRKLALKTARNAGCIKIPGVQYPDGAETAKRSKCVAWRASVETSSSIEQLALQIRELDLFVRWDDIENTHPHPTLDKESMKSTRLFKKAILRRKCVEGGHVKYLLDFGKRRSIPEVVVKHGSKINESTDERKKYWLNESFVPLHLLKSFEERRITRKAGKTNSTKVRRGDGVMKKPLRTKGFDYLFSRAEKADCYQCGHCNKNVPISEAVSCQHCNGFFHKRHVMKSSEAITAECMYTCHRCRAGKHVQNISILGKRKLSKHQKAKKLTINKVRHAAILRSKPRRGRPSKCAQVPPPKKKKSQYHKKPIPKTKRDANVSVGLTLRRSARNAKPIQLPSNCFAGGKIANRNVSYDDASVDNPKGFSCRKRRTTILHAFWINGLRFSKKPNDGRVAKFKRRKLLASEISAKTDDAPKCSLCSERGFQSASLYIGCEVCRDWFHGDAFGLHKENIGCVIGFKCHACRGRSPPVCPFVVFSSNTGTLFTKATSQTGTQNAQESPGVVDVQKETDCVHEFHLADKVPLSPSEFQTLEKFDGVLQDKTPVLDSKVTVESGSPACMEVDCNVIGSQNGDLTANMLTGTEDAQELPEVRDVQTETDCTQGFHLVDKVSLPTLEVQTVQNFDENLDHDTTPILDSELRVENGSRACREVGCNPMEGQNGEVETNLLTGSQNAQRPREVHGIQNETDFLECHLEGDIPLPRLDVQTVQNFDATLDHKTPVLDDMEVQTVQNFDENLDHDTTPILDSELRVENGSPACKVGCNPMVSQNGDIETNLLTGGPQDAQRPREVHGIQNETDFFLESQLEGSIPLPPLEVQTVQNFDVTLDQKTPVLDDLRVENDSPACKEVDDCYAVETQKGDLNANVNHS